MPEASPVLSARGKVAAFSRSRPDDDPEYIAARQNLNALRLEEHIEKTLAAAPPLTDEQRTRLAELLRPVRRNGGA